MVSDALLEHGAIFKITLKTYQTWAQIHPKTSIFQINIPYWNSSTVLENMAYLMGLYCVFLTLFLRVFHLPGWIGGLTPFWSFLMLSWSDKKIVAMDYSCFWLAETAWWNWLIFDIEHPWKVLYKVSPFHPNGTKTRPPNKSCFWLADSLKNLLLWNFFAKWQVSNTGSASWASS